MADRFDAVIIGAGPGGEALVSRLPKQGLRVALVERELVGGECAYWACVPSKTLLRPPEARAEARRAAGLAEPEQRWREIADYRDVIIRNLDDSSAVAGYAEMDNVEVFKGAGRIDGPGRVDVDGQALATDRIMIATGTDPRIPPIEGLEQAGYWTNREATTLEDVPASAVVLGGGPVGVELGQMLRRYGAEVTLVESGHRLLAREDPGLGELLADALREEGIVLRLGARAQAVERRDGGRVVRLEDGDEVVGQELLVAIGREPRVTGIGLESLGIEPDPKGIATDERCRVIRPDNGGTPIDGVWALGDVTGAMPFTHVAKYHARLVCNDVAGRPARADLSAIPRVVFSDPEVAAVGMTSEQARGQGIELVESSIDLYSSIARPVTYGEGIGGRLTLLADGGRGVLVGAWAAGPLASEWIHMAVLAVKTATPVAVLRDTVPQFPTFAEAYQVALESLAL